MGSSIRAGAVGATIGIVAAATAPAAAATLARLRSISLMCIWAWRFDVAHCSNVGAPLEDEDILKSGAHGCVAVEKAA